MEERNLRFQEESKGTRNTRVDGQVSGNQLATSQQKTDDHLRWDDYFMALASLASMRSKDPNRKVGACIVNGERRVVALGYNGMPNGCNDDEMPWERRGNWEDTKYPFVCHAEMNAIMNKTSADLKNCVIYTTMFPCNECVKLIIQAGINRVHYLSDKHSNNPIFIAARRLMDTVKIPYSQHVSRRKIVIDLDTFAADSDFSDDHSGGGESSNQNKTISIASGFNVM